MKQYLLVIGLSIVLTVFYSSCKKDPLVALRSDELTQLDKYVKDNNLTDFKDDSGIYFKVLETSTDTMQIRKGYKAMIYFKITTVANDSTAVFSNDDTFGHYYNPTPFTVDVVGSTSTSLSMDQIAGLHIGLKKMKVGEKAFMVIPSELAFKALDYSTAGIPRFSTLLATITIQSALTPKEQSEQ